MASENDRDFGMEMETSGEFDGDGLLLLQAVFDEGLDAVMSPCLKETLRCCRGSGSKVGMPVAEVVVVHVLVDIRRSRFGGRLRRNLCKKAEQKLEFSSKLRDG